MRHIFPRILKIPTHRGTYRVHLEAGAVGLESCQLQSLCCLLSSFKDNECRGAYAPQIRRGASAHATAEAKINCLASSSRTAHFDGKTNGGNCKGADIR